MAVEECASYCFGFHNNSQRALSAQQLTFPIGAEMTANQRWMRNITKVPVSPAAFPILQRFHSCLNWILSWNNNWVRQLHINRRLAKEKKNRWPYIGCRWSLTSIEGCSPGGQEVSQVRKAQMQEETLLVSWCGLVHTVQVTFLQGQIPVFSTSDKSKEHPLKFTGGLVKTKENVLFPRNPWNSLMQDMFFCPKFPAHQRHCLSPKF